VASPDTARRLAPEDRRRQLVELALTICARDGWDALSLDDVAARAGVTRGLLYRYFPAGRSDLLAAVADEAANRLGEGFQTDPDVPLSAKTPANLALVLEHAQGPSDAWLVYREAAASALPEVRRRIDALLDELVAAIAFNNFGVATPPPRTRLAIRGYIAFAGQAIDDWRERGDVAREELFALLQSVFAATIAAATAEVP
jgi:AcrR family transcriptional regulator